MKLKFLDGLMAAVKTKDEAQITAALVKVMDEAREEEEEKRKEEEAAKDKARDEKIEKLVKDCIAAAFKARDEEAEAKKKAEDEEAEAEKKKAADAEAEKANKEEDEELEEQLEEESGSKDARKAKDSALLADAFEAVKMNAEIIAPGIAIPTFDKAAEPRKTFRDCNCGLRRGALRTALSDPSTAAIIATVRGRALDAVEIDGLTPSDVRTIFNGVAAIKRAANNSAATRDASSTGRTQASTTDNLTPTQRFIANARAMKAGKK